MDAQALTDAAAAAYFAPFGVVDGHVLPRQLVDVFDRGEQARVPLLAGFNSGEIRSLTLPRAARAGQCRPNMNASSASAMATSPTHSCGFIPAATCTRASWRRRGTHCMAGLRSAWSIEQAALGRPLSSICSTMAIPRRCGGPARLPRQRAAVCVRHARRARRRVGRRPRTPPRKPRCPRRCSTIGPALPATAVPRAANQPDWPAFGSTGAYMDFTDAPHASVHLFPGMYELHEEVDVPASMRAAIWPGTGTSASFRRACPQKALPAAPRNDNFNRGFENEKENSASTAW